MHRGRIYFSFLHSVLSPFREPPMRLTVKSTFEVETYPGPSRCRLTVQPDTTVQQVKEEALKEFQWDTVLVPDDIVLSLNKRV